MAGYLNKVLLCVQFILGNCNGVFVIFMVVKVAVVTMKIGEYKCAQTGNYNAIKLETIQILLLSSNFIVKSNALLYLNPKAVHRHEHSSIQLKHLPIENSTAVAIFKP